MINIENLKFIITTTLDEINLNSESATNLLLGTIAQESMGGYYLKQIKGPALGIYQIEPHTASDVHVNYLQYRRELLFKIHKFRNKVSEEINLMGNLHYATAIARIIYYRAKPALPDPNDIPGLADYWKEHYNTSAGRGKTEYFVENYRRFVLKED